LAHYIRTSKWTTLPCRPRFYITPGPTDEDFLQDKVISYTDVPQRIVSTTGSILLKYGGVGVGRGPKVPYSGWVWYLAVYPYRLP
jgi:hypothetical protein